MYSGSMGPRSTLALFRGRAEGVLDLVAVQVAEAEFLQAGGVDEVAVGVQVVELGVAAGDEQPHGRQGRFQRVVKPDGQQVRLAMVDAHQGLARGQGQALGEAQTHQQAAQQPRPAGHGDAVQVRRGDAAAGEQLARQAGQAPQMLPRGQFRHHAAEDGMDRVLRGQPLQHQPAVLHQGHGRFVAGGLDAQDQHRLAGAVLGRPPDAMPGEDLLHLADLVARADEQRHPLVQVRGR